MIRAIQNTYKLILILAIVLVLAIAYWSYYQSPEKKFRRWIRDGDGLWVESTYYGKCNDGVAIKLYIYSSIYIPKDDAARDSILTRCSTRKELGIRVVGAIQSAVTEIIKNYSSNQLPHWLFEDDIIRMANKKLGYLDDYLSISYSYFTYSFVE